MSTSTMNQEENKNTKGKKRPTLIYYKSEASSVVSTVPYRVREY